MYWTGCDFGWFYLDIGFVFAECWAAEEAVHFLFVGIFLYIQLLLKLLLPLFFLLLLFPFILQPLILHPLQLHLCMLIWEIHDIIYKLPNLNLYLPKGVCLGAIDHPKCINVLIHQAFVEVKWLDSLGALLSRGSWRAWIEFLLLLFFLLGYLFI